MSHEDAVALIQNAVTGDVPQRWADLGCGTGTFTKALYSLLPSGSYITAIDRERQHLDLPGAEFVRANFEKDELGLSGLDGILMANSLHYVKDKAALIRKLEVLFADDPKFIVIEYDNRKANPWVPYLIPFEQLESLFKGLGYTKIRKIAERASAYSGMIYCALIEGMPELQR
jgi:trans-aconitate methyltransferase